MTEREIKKLAIEIALDVTFDYMNQNNVASIKIPEVGAVGFTVSAIPFTGSIKIVVDRKTNVALVVSPGVEGKSDVEGNLGIFIESSYNADSYLDTLGSSVNKGVGVDTGIGPGLGYNHSHFYIENNDMVTFHSLEGSFNASVSPVEIHGGVTTGRELFKLNIIDLILGE